MLSNKNIRKLADYVLLNAYSVCSSGLYNGKAGISLCLFEVARYLNDKNIEKHAFELLQEALLSENDNICFEDGLSGIGYVLLYLINHKYIDANFDDLFGAQTQKILDFLETRKQEPANLLFSLRIIQFLTQINKKRNDPKIDKYIIILFEAVELYLSIQFFDFTSQHYCGNKMAVLSVFSDYLRLVYLSNYDDFSKSLIESYASLYRKGRIKSSYFIGFYLEKIIIENSLPDYTDVINRNKQDSFANLKPNMFTLRELLDLLNLLHQDTTFWISNGIKLENILLDYQGKELEENILRLIPDITFIAGYGFGVARLLRYCVKNAS
jgi:hypothetical protein